MPTTLAPIAVFVFKRPEHTQRTLDALSVNPEFAASPLYIFADGARNETEAPAVTAVRDLISTFPHPNKTIIAAPANRGLADSITAGVTRLCEEFGRVIVVEDDLVVASTFLDYMNTALARYADEPRVMQISGHMFPVDLHADEDAVFLPLTTSWGWATWQRAWREMQIQPARAVEMLSQRRWRYHFDLDGAFPSSRMLAQRLAGHNSSWAIWWYFQVFARQGLSLFPAHSLVRNDGFDGSGTHCNSAGVAAVTLIDFRVSRFPSVAVSNTALATYRGFLKRDRGFLKLTFDRIWRIFFSTRGSHAA